MTYVAVGLAGFWFCYCIYLLYNRSSVHMLKNVPVGKSEPSVAVIIAVRNEEQHLETALHSVSQLDYSNFRIIVVNDRSTDGTGRILQQLSGMNDNIEVVTIYELPGGWLGKNNALYTGYRHTTEEWMLFTDADVIFEKDTLQKALSFATTNQLDHLTVLPFVSSGSEVLNSFMATFMMMLETRQRPWALRNKNSKAYLGVGAFNLVRRSAYEKAGTHKIISLRPDDDLKLGELIKRCGGNQDVLYGHQQISLEWYSSVKEFIAGLMKNSFSVFNYKWYLVLPTFIPLLMFFILPLPTLIFMGGELAYTCAAIVLLSQFLIMYFNKGSHIKWWFPLMIPIASTVMIYILWKAMMLTLKNNGIYWRDTFYSLDELRQQT